MTAYHSKRLKEIKVDGLTQAGNFVQEIVPQMSDLCRLLQQKKSEGI